MIMMLILFALVQCKENPESQLFEKAHPSSKNSTRYQVFQNNDGSFGYDIYQDNKVVIHQPYLPAMPGNKGFKTEEKAIQTAQLVLSKISAGIFPPSISKEEVMGIVGRDL